MVVPSSIN